MTTINREMWMTIRDDPHKIGELVNSDNVNAPLDENGTTPLMLCENAEVAKFLIEIGADFKRSDKSGKTVLSYVNNSSIREVCYKKIKEKLEKDIPAAFDKLFIPTDPTEREIRHWTFVSAISSAKGFEHWWKFELLGHFQRKGVLPLCNKDLIVCAEEDLINKCNNKNKEGGNTDLVFVTPDRDPNGEEWYKTNLDLKPKILVPIELKHCPINSYKDKSRIISKYFGNESNTVYSDALKIQDIIGCDDFKVKIKHNEYNEYTHKYDCTFGVLALLVTGLTTTEKQENLKQEIFNKAKALPKRVNNLSCVLDKEIQLAGKTNDIWISHAWAHQFVWIIEKS